MRQVDAQLVPPEVAWKRPAPQLVQLAADCAEYLPAEHGVQADGLLPEKPAAWAKPPLAANEPAAHAPAHCAVA